MASQPVLEQIARALCHCLWRNAVDRLLATVHCPSASALDWASLCVYVGSMIQLEILAIAGCPMVADDLPAGCRAAAVDVLEG